jgi:hypothetical protein
VGRFVSADTIAPGKADPQNRNRYSYTLNNPLRWVDPSGHCVEDYEKTSAGCRQYLNDHGWSDILGDWAYDELSLFVASIQDMKRAMGWLMADYKSAMTGNGTKRLQARIADQSETNPNLAGEMNPNEPGVLKMNIYRKNAFYNYDGSRRDITSIKGLFVHEQAHVWDHASGKALSNGLADAVQGRWETDTGTGHKRWRTVDPMPSKGGEGGPQEDWAETVMVMVYGNHERADAPVSATRSQYVHQAAQAVTP